MREEGEKAKSRKSPSSSQPTPHRPKEEEDDFLERLFPKKKCQKPFNSLFSRAPPPGASRSCSRPSGTPRTSARSPCRSGRRRGRTGQTGRRRPRRPCPRTTSTRPRGTSRGGRCRPPLRRRGCTCRLSVLFEAGRRRRGRGGGWGGVRRRGGGRRGRQTSRRCSVAAAGRRRCSPYVVVEEGKSRNSSGTLPRFFWTRSRVPWPRFLARRRGRTPLDLPIDGGGQSDLQRPGARGVSARVSRERKRKEGKKLEQKTCCCLPLSSLENG